MNNKKLKPLWGEYKRRYKGSFTNTMFKKMNLRPPTIDVVLLYLGIILIIYTLVSVLF
jgi:hypothetical protein